MSLKSDFVSKAKLFARKYFIPWYSRLSGLHWENSQKTKVLIETWKGFLPEDWLRSLHDGFPEWGNHFEVRFIGNRIERHILLSEAEIYVSTTLTPRTIAMGPRLKWVCLCMAGVEYLEGMSIPSNLKISTSSGISSRSVAEHVLGLILALDRRFYRSFEQQQKWRWDQSGILEGIRGLQDRTVGIIGMGNIGQAVSNISQSLGMKVIGLDLRRDLSISGVECIYNPGELEQLLKISDIVVLCVPSTIQTRGMIRRSELETMRPDAFLINVARGDLIDEAHLAEALRAGTIAGAALDVLTVEPPLRNHPLRGCPRLIITPHVAGNIYSSRRDIQARFVRNLIAYFSGKELEGEVA